VTPDPAGEHLAAAREALKLALAPVPIGADPDSTPMWREVQARAALALAEELRTANLLTLVSLSSRSGGQIDPAVFAQITGRLDVGGSVETRP
jgi:hypothetical protein